MKKIKWLLLTIGLLIILPSNVFAGVKPEPFRSKEDAERDLNKLVIMNEDGSCTWDIKMINPETMANTYCDYKKSDIYERYPYSKNLNEQEFEQLMNDLKSDCRLNTVSSVIEAASRKVGNDNWIIYSAIQDFSSFDKNNVTLTSWYNLDENDYYSQDRVSKTCNIEYEVADMKILKEAEKTVKTFDSNYTIYSLNSFNTVYHYGSIFENNRIDSEMILYKFPEFKKLLMDNPEFEYEIAWLGGGGMPTETGCSGYVFAYKNGIPYGMKSVNFTIDNRLYVDKDLPGTPVEKATARLNEFFKNTVDIEFDLTVYAENYNVNGNVGTFTNVKIGNHTTPIFIMEVDKKDLDKFEVKAHHKKYNINVVTNSYDVPIDATLEAKDVSKEIKLNNNYKILGAYNIDVVKTGTGTYIKQIEDGIEVFIPVNGKKVNEKLKVFHITDDNKTGDEYEGTVVEIDGQQFVKFRTNHFSTYAVAENTINNPNTVDRIGESIILLIIGLCGCFVSYKLKPRRN